MPRERVLRFPVDQSPGAILTRPKGELGVWKDISAARGEIAIDRGVDVYLEVSASALDDEVDLSALDYLAADDLHSINLSFTPVKDDDLLHVARLDGLKCIYLFHTDITARGVQYLSRLQDLEEIRLTESIIGDVGLFYLQGMRALTRLEVSGTEVTDDGLGYLQSHDRLVYLDLSWNIISGTGIDFLNSLISLRTLILGMNPLEWEYIKRIPMAYQLDTLHLWNTGIADDRLILLRNMVNLTDLDLSFNPINGPGLHHLRDLSNLAVLKLSAATSLHEQSLTYLPPLQNLNTLIVASSKVKIDGLHDSLHFPKLRSMELQSSGFVDDDAQHLARFPLLERLDLSNTTVGSAGMIPLQELSHLRDLRLDRTAVDDDALAHIGRLSSLEHLSLSNTQITGAGLAHLAALPHLRTLHLSFTHIDNDDLLPLRQIASLEYLGLIGTVVDMDGVRKAGFPPTTMVSGVSREG